MNVAMLSLWRNDANRNLAGRAAHLLRKTHPALRWIWVVGDSTDSTFAQLAELAQGHDVTVVNVVTGIAGEEPAPRLRRLGQTANVWFDFLRATDDYLLLHESDLISPPDVVERFLAHAAAGRCPVAGWPTLTIGGETLFYDIWGYRKDGARFVNRPPYHAGYQPDAPFPVDSVGSCWLFHAADVRAGARCGPQAALDLCAALRARGRQHWVDPTLPIVQPPELWTPHRIDA